MYQERIKAKQEKNIIYTIDDNKHNEQGKRETEPFFLSIIMSRNTTLKDKDPEYANTSSLFTLTYYIKS